ncbi:uncharacterized protein [Aegilops tauschii subsp. strangulata]|nr:uncharacterized protein LOC109762998 [Aegilops tauschii subsp. strangulata]
MGGRRKSKRGGEVPNPRTHEEDRSVALAAAAAAQAHAAAAAQARAAADSSRPYCRTCLSRDGRGGGGGGPCSCPDTTSAQPSGSSRGSAVPAQLYVPCRAPNPCQDHVAGPSSAPTQPQPSVSYLTKLLGATTFKDTATSSASPQAVAETPPPKPTIYVNRPPDWYFSIYIRIDRSGSFHTYPHLGGPFKSLQEVEKAIERYLHDKRHKTLWNEQAGDEIIIKKALYWPDGRTRKCSDEHVVEYTRERMSLMLQALLDKYNEDRNLVGDLAYEFKDFLHYQTIYEDYKWYKHFNFTTKTKDGTEDLFFAEVTKGKDNALVANCFCKIESNENGHCYGCINHGIIDMKHPGKADAYSGGHLNVHLPFGGRRSRPNTWTGSKEDVAAEEARLRYIYGIR